MDLNKLLRTIINNRLDPDSAFLRRKEIFINCFYVLQFLTIPKIGCEALGNSLEQRRIENQQSIFVSFHLLKCPEQISALGVFPLVGGNSGSRPFSM